MDTIEIDDDAMEAAWVRIDKVIPKGRSRMVVPASEQEPDFGNESDDAGALAHHYASVWNERMEADADIPDDEFERAGEELADSGWVVHFDQRSERWFAIPSDLWLKADGLKKYAKEGEPVGGVSVGGRFYRGLQESSWVDLYDNG